jgi:hypothetical protein
VTKNGIDASVMENGVNASVMENGMNASKAKRHTVINFTEMLVNRHQPMLLSGRRQA